LSLHYDEPLSHVAFDFNLRRFTMEYLPTNGDKEFIKLSIKLAFGDDAKAVAAGTVAAVQTLSGTGACRLMVGRCSLTAVSKPALKAPMVSALQGRIS
jgi:aspartate/tyrosine/aromatic aminotransferase